MEPDPMTEAASALDVPPGPVEPPRYGYAPGVDLYVMQNALGRIKIGRSGNPEVRRQTLEMACGVEIALVAIAPGQGDQERYLHSRLASFREMGEWFSGAAKDTLRAVLETPDLEFPY